jgi:hypothetical protein
MNAVSDLRGDRVSIRTNRFGVAIGSLARAASIAARENSLAPRWNLPETREADLGGQSGEAYE